jgi:hypothetical protein
MFTKINLEFSLDITIILLSMIRSLMNNNANNNDRKIYISDDEKSNNDNNNATKDYPIILLQIFRFMYHNCDDFRTMASNPDFLSSLVTTLYPYNDLTDSQAATPLIEVKVWLIFFCNFNTIFKKFCNFFSLLQKPYVIQHLNTIVTFINHVYLILKLSVI